MFDEEISQGFVLLVKCWAKFWPCESSPPEGQVLVKTNHIFYSGSTYKFVDKMIEKIYIVCKERFLSQSACLSLEIFKKV